MKRWIVWVVVTGGLVCVAAPQPVRNPFWPVGYEGERAVISPVPRVRKAPMTAPQPEKEKSSAPVVQEEEKPPTGEATVEEWRIACRQIKVGVVMRARKKGAEELASVIFNGKICNVGEEVLMDTKHRRFIWKFAGIGRGGVVRLVRVRTEPIVQKPASGSASKGFIDFIKNQIKE